MQRLASGSTTPGALFVLAGQCTIFQMKFTASPMHPGDIVAVMYTICSPCDLLLPRETVDVRRREQNEVA